MVVLSSVGKLRSEGRRGGEAAPAAVGAGTPPPARGGAVAVVRGPPAGGGGGGVLPPPPGAAIPEPTATPSLKIVTVLFASAVPLKVGVVTLVLSSVGKL